MSVFDDADALYRPKRRSDGSWGVWDKVDERFVDGYGNLTEAAATRAAMRANDNLAAAENATWD